MSEATPTAQELTTRLIEFRDARDWRQFHSLKDLIVSLNLEAAELLELTQWKSDKAFDELASTPAMLQELKHECADVFNYLLLIAERCDFDLLQAAQEKIDLNDAKYPVDKSRGTSKKYTEL